MTLWYNLFLNSLSLSLSLVKYEIYLLLCVLCVCVCVATLVVREDIFTKSRGGIYNSSTCDNNSMEL
jgi:hypothetical protein